MGRETLSAENAEPTIMRYELSDTEWSVLRVMLPNKPRGVARVDDRRVLNGIFWVLRSGAPWRDLPKVYGPRTTRYNRFVRWQRAGIRASKLRNEENRQIIEIIGDPDRI